MGLSKEQQEGAVQLVLGKAALRSNFQGDRLDAFRLGVQSAVGVLGEMITMDGGPGSDEVGRRAEHCDQEPLEEGEE